MSTQVRDYALRINLIKDGTIATVNFGERSRLMDIDGGYWGVSEVCEGELLLTKHNWHSQHDGRVKGSGTGSKRVLQFTKSETLAILSKYVGEYGALYPATIHFNEEKQVAKRFKVKLSERSNFTNMYSKHVTTVTEKPVIVEESKRYVEDKDKIKELYDKFPDEAKKVDILPVKADDELEALKQLMNEKIYKYEADIRTINSQIEELMDKLHEAEDNHLALSRALDILNKNDKEVR